MRQCPAILPNKNSAGIVATIPALFFYHDTKSKGEPQPSIMAFNSARSRSLSRFVMLRRLMPMVETLCSRAEVAGGKIPKAPRPMRVPLKPMTKR